MNCVSEVAEGVYQITPGNSPSLCSEVYFIADDRPALIETGPTAIADSILDDIARLGYAPASISYIALTHIHIDHAGGAGYLAERLPEARVIVHSQVVHHLVEPSRLITGTEKAFGPDFAQEYGPILAVPESRIESVQNGETFSLGQRELQVIHAPGHAPHHLCFYEPGERWLFCGDGLGVYFHESDLLVPSVAPPAFDLEVMLETAERMLKLSPTALFYSHYAPGWKAEALIRRFQDVVKGCAKLIQEAMSAGAEAEEIEQMVVAYLRSGAPNAPEFKPDLVRLMTQGYMVYFRNRGLA